MAIEEDKTVLDRLHGEVDAGSVLKAILAEVKGVIGKVTNWSIVPTSGFAVCFYDTNTGKPKSYAVTYQQGNIGNLVHELIHVAVNEAHGVDFVNYESDASKVVAREYDAKGRCINEELRQAKLMKDSENTRVSQNLASLIAQSARVSELSPEQRSEIKKKFEYGLGKPHIEYDTVITQVLVWLHEWGFPTSRNRMNSPGAARESRKTVDQFFNELEKKVHEAHQRRRNGTG